MLSCVGNRAWSIVEGDGAVNGQGVQERWPCAGLVARTSRHGIVCASGLAGQGEGGRDVAVGNCMGMCEAMPCWVDGHEQVGAFLVRAGAEGGCWQGAGVLHGVSAGVPGV